MSSSSARTDFIQTAQESIVEALSEVLFIEPPEIDKDSSFLDLGLDSILAVELIVILRRRFGGQLSIDTLYAHSTVTTLAEHLARDAQEQTG